MYPTSLVALQRFRVVLYDSYKRVKTRLIVVMGDAVVFTNNVFSYVFAEIKRLFLRVLSKSWALFVT